MSMFLVFSCTFLVLAVSLPFIRLLFKKKNGTNSLPPGKTGWPIIGETLDFVMCARRGTPEKFVRDRMNNYSPDVFKTSLLGDNMAVLCGPSANKFLFSNENRLVTSWWPYTFMKIVHSPASRLLAPKESRKMRRLVNEFSKPETLRKFLGVMDCIAKEQIEKAWEPKQQVSAFKLGKSYSFALACRLFLNIEDPKHIADLSSDFETVSAGFMNLPINFPGTTFNRSIKTANKIREQLLPIVKQRKVDILEKGESAISQDILSHMLLSTLCEDGEFPADQLVAERVLGLLLAGHDTSSIVITHIIKYLAENSHVYDELLKEQLDIANTKMPDEALDWEDVQKMRYSWNVASEAMRLRPPIPGTFRQAITDISYAGFTIPKGWKIHWSVHSTHKNPIYFPDPEKFDPSRFQGNIEPYSFVPFGGGPRMCPGKEYARLDILVFMHYLVTKFKWKIVNPNEKITYNPSPKPVNGLLIRLHPHEGQN